MVLLWHAAGRTNFPAGSLGPLKSMVLMGWAGVDLFFALSGFLITTLILREEGERREDGRHGFSLKNFYLRRSLRILPPFYLVLGASLFLLPEKLFPSVLGAQAPAPSETLALATFWSNYFYRYHPLLWPPPAFSPYWSLCVEEHFYLLWPLFLTVVRRPRYRLALALGLCLLLAITRWLSATLGLDPIGAIHMLSHYRIDSILWGGAAALAFDDLARQGRTVSLALAAAGLGVIALIRSGHVSTSPTPLGQSAGLTALALFAALLVVHVARAPASILSRALEMRALSSVGRVSYGMYLLHFQVLDVVSRVVLASFPTATLPHFGLLYGTFVATTYLVARLMFETVERRFLALRERFRFAHS
jgi:peptidoglycan/LPS O-acetylase OafA/YrhL